MYGSNEDCNVEMLKNNTHQALHTLFANKMIADQLLTTVSLSERALREDVRRRLIDVLTSRDPDDPYERYDHHAIK